MPQQIETHWHFVEVEAREGEVRSTNATEQERIENFWWWNWRKMKKIVV